MEPPLAAVGSAPVAVLSQSSGIAAILCHEGVVTWCTIIAPFTCCCTNSAVASIAVVTELSSKREVCVLGTPSSQNAVPLVTSRVTTPQNGRTLTGCDLEPIFRA